MSGLTSSSDPVASRDPVPAWSACIDDHVRPGRRTDGAYLIGVVEGEGIGPEVVSGALQVLRALESASALSFEMVTGGTIGLESEEQGAPALPGAFIEFCDDLFARGGALLAGPGGGRFVYDLRRRFDLFCKISPMSAPQVLARASRLRPEHLDGADGIIVRDNAAGIYQGTWRDEVGADGSRVAHHAFSYSERDVRRIVDVAARIAAQRRGQLAVVLKDGGIPAVSALWRDVAADVARSRDVRLDVLNVDYAAYRLLHSPRELDVMVTPNLFGDLLIDLAGLVQGSRGMTYSGNFGPGTAAVYQTNHGGAHDLTGTDRANPLGQVCSLAMLLRESFDLHEAAQVIETAMEQVLSEGLRTEDVAEPGCNVIGTREMAAHVAERVATLARGRDLA